MFYSTVLLVSITTGQSINDESTLDISAFNVRIFGANKATDQSTMDTLVKVKFRNLFVFVVVQVKNNVLKLL